MKGSLLKQKYAGKMIIICLTILIIAIVFSDLKRILVKQPVSSHQLELLKSFELMWNSSIGSTKALIDSCALEDRRIFIRLDTDGNQLILPIWEEKFLFSKLYLTNFDSDTGEINWQTLLGSNDVALGSNSDSVFSVVRDTEKCTPDERGYCDAVRISSYNISSGIEEWSANHGNMNRASSLCVNDMIVSISGYATRASFREKISLSADTGEVLTYQEISPPSNSYYENWNPSRLGFDEDDIISSSYKQNGKYLFFLTEQNNTLWAIDLDISKIVGRVQFDGVSFRARSYINEFVVASSSNVVAVYLGDSDQLFVFRFLPVE